MAWAMLFFRTVCARYVPTAHACCDGAMPLGFPGAGMPIGPAAPSAPVRPIGPRGPVAPPDGPMGPVSPGNPRGPAGPAGPPPPGTSKMIDIRSYGAWDVGRQ